MLEAEWQEQLIELAHMLGWSHLHVRKSIGKRGGNRGWQTTTNIKGWPDLFMWHPERGFVAVELKVKPNKATREQLYVLDQLARAGARSFVWYPEDLEDAQLVLSGRK